MIGKLTGAVDYFDEDCLIIDVGGVGDKVMTPLSARPGNLSNEDKVSLFIHTHVREDAIILYGFFTQAALEVFEKLISVNGVGPKLGQTVLASLGSEELQAAVVSEDVARLTSVPGVGKKTAERMILELKSKLAGKVTIVKSAGGKEKSNRAYTDAFEAMLALGYSQQEVKLALEKVSKEAPELSDTSKIVRQALKFAAG